MWCETGKILWEKCKATTYFYCTALHFNLKPRVQNVSLFFVSIIPARRLMLLMFKTCFDVGCSWLKYISIEIFQLKSLSKLHFTHFGSHSLSLTVISWLICGHYRATPFPKRFIIIGIKHAHSIPYQTEVFVKLIWR